MLIKHFNYKALCQRKRSAVFITPLIRSSKQRLLELKRTFNIPHKASMEGVILREVFELNLKWSNLIRRKTDLSKSKKDTKRR